METQIIAFCFALPSSCEAILSMRVNLRERASCYRIADEMLDWNLLMAASLRTKISIGRNVDSQKVRGVGIESRVGAVLFFVFFHSEYQSDRRVFSQKVCELREELGKKDRSLNVDAFILPFFRLCGLKESRSCHQYTESSS
jgi:hypothetical protein